MKRDAALRSFYACWKLRGLFPCLTAVRSLTEVSAAATTAAGAPAGWTLAARRASTAVAERRDVTVVDVGI